MKPEEKAKLVEQIIEEAVKEVQECDFDTIEKQDREEFGFLVTAIAVCKALDMGEKKDNKKERKEMTDTQKLSLLHKIIKNATLKAKETEDNDPETFISTVAVLAFNAGYCLGKAGDEVRETEILELIDSI